MFKSKFGKIGSWLKSAGGTIVSTVKKIPDLIKKIQFGKIGTMIKSAWGWIKTTAGKVPGAIKGACAAIKSFFKPAAEAAATVA